MITGDMLKCAFLSGANNIQNHRTEVDALNVFPVPDGDTGANMSMTIGAAARELQVMPESDVATVSKKTASALLRGARGNSGVILSLIFRGVSKGLKGLETADGVQLAKAFDLGRESAYKAVMKPTEGTILTVIRLAAAAAVEAKETDCAKVMEILCAAAKGALLKTPEMLPVLKEAGVVDAGGQGLLYILEGMRSYLADGVMIEAADKKDGEAATDNAKKAYAYRCALKILCVPNAPADQNALQGNLEALGGEVRVSKTQTGAMEVEMQSDAPGNVLQAALEFGPITNVTVENLKEGQPLESEAPKAEETPEEKTEAPEAPKLERVEPEKEYGFVAVAAGAGVIELFKELAEQ